MEYIILSEKTHMKKCIIYQTSFIQSGLMLRFRFI